MTRKPARRHRSLLNGLEQLEDRRVFATRIWDGGSPTNDFWMNRFNWEGNTAPVAGDSLIFPDSIRVTDRSLVNNFPNGTEFDNITIQGGAYLIRGNRIQLNGDFTYGPKSGTVIDNSKINLNIEFGPGDHKLEIFSLEKFTQEELQFNGQLSDNGSGDIFISGNAEIIFGGDAGNTINTHTIIVDNDNLVAGQKTELILDKPDNVRAIFGDLEIGNLSEVRTQVDIKSGDIIQKIGQFNPSSEVSIRDFGELEVAIETIEDLTLASGAEVTIDTRRDGVNNEDNNIQGALTLGGTLTVTGGQARIVRDNNINNPRIKLGQETTVNVAQGATMQFFVATSGGDLIKDGKGGLQLDPKNASNQHDDTTVVEGNLFLEGAGRITVPDDLFIETGSTVIVSQADEQIADTSDVTVDGGKFFVSNGIEETIATLTLKNNGFASAQGADTEFDVTGAVTVNTGLIDVLDQATVSFQQVLTIVDSTVRVSGAELRLNEVVLNHGELTTLDAAAKILLTGGFQVLANAVPSEIKGRIVLRPGEHTFNVANGTAVNDLLVSAVIADESGFGGGGGSIKKIGPGRMLLAANNTYVGKTTLNTGVLVLNGLQANEVVLVNGGFLAGKGDVLKINQVGGTVNPGVNVGILKATTSTFIGAGGKFKAQINGATVGTQFDQLRTGTLQLGSANNHPTLEVDLNFVPTIGQKFKIINVLGTDVLPANQFFQDLDGNLLPEGAALKINGLDFTITYKGNQNDVVLTRNAPPAFVNRAITAEANEGEQVLLSGTITETDPNQTFFLDVDWGDGSGLETFTFPPGSNPNISVGHTYLDDRPTTNDTYKVRFKWRDEFGGNNGAVLSTVIHNKAPEIQAITASLPPINANAPFTLQGSFTDASSKDSFKVYIQWEANGDFESFDVAAGEDSFSKTHTYTTTGQKQVTVLVNDDDLGLDQQELTIDVV